MKTRKLTFGDMSGVVLPIGLVALWQLLGGLGMIDTFFLPTPKQIGAAFIELLSSGEMLQHIARSFQRAMTGFVCGAGAALVIGFLTGYSRHSEQLIDPTLQFLRMTPSLAVAPLIILWFGFGETSKIVIVAEAAFFPMYVHTFLGIRGVDRKLFEVSRVLGFGTGKTLLRLILPAAAPGILLGIRLSLAVSWLGLVVAELIGSKEGIGHLINFGQQFFRTDYIFVGVILFALAGKLIDSLLRWLERKLLVWQDGFQG